MRRGEDFIGFIFGLMATFLKDEANENKQELSSKTLNYTK